MRCLATPRSSGPTSARSTRRWPRASRAPRPCSAPITFTYRVHAAPVFETEGSPAEHLIVTVRDVTDEMLQQQKLAAIHQAGVELADLTPDEVAEMDVEERIELLKSNILHCTQDVLNFDVVEIRMLDQETGRLAAVAGGGHEARGRAAGAVRRAAGQRRHRLCGRDRQELPVRGHQRGPVVHRGGPGRPQFAHRAADAARRGDRHVQRGEPRDRAPSPRAICSSWRSSPATWRSR